MIIHRNYYLFLSCLLGLNLLLGACSSAVKEPQTPTISLRASSDGERLEVWGTNMANLYSVDLIVQFDANRLQVADMDNGMEGIQIQAGRLPKPDFMAMNQADNENGTFHYMVTQLGTNTTPVNEGIIAVIHWKNGFDQTAKISFKQAVLVDGDGMPLRAMTTVEIP